MGLDPWLESVQDGGTSETGGCRQATFREYGEKRRQVTGRDMVPADRVGISEWNLLLRECQDHQIIPYIWLAHRERRRSFSGSNYRWAALSPIVSGQG